MLYYIMLDFMIPALKNSLSGKGIHMNPLQAVDGLSHNEAKQTPRDDCHSCYQILHHIVFWQDLMLDALRGNEVSWPQSNDVSWPANEGLDSQSKWDDIVARFGSGIEEARLLAEKSDDLSPLPAWPGFSVGRGLLVFGQHNAYHIGEIVATRQSLGLWPPPGKSQTHF